MTTLQARIIAALVGLLVLLAAGVGLYAWGHSDGDEAGADRIQKKWDKAVKDAEAETARIRGEGYTLAAEYEAKLQTLEARYARTNVALRKALQQPVACPASGRVGDVVLPADLIDGMFNRERLGAGAPGPASTQPDPAVR